jgi:hypothetical protein
MTSHDFEKRQRHWSAPREIARSRPRWVTYTAGGRVLLLLAFALMAGGGALTMGLGARAVREAQDARWLRESGVETTGEVARLLRLRGDEPRHRMVYRFEVEGRSYERQVNLSARSWERLQVGDPVPIRYVPFRPELNYPRGSRPNPLPPVLPVLVALGFSCGVAVILFSLRRQRELLIEGRAAPAVVSRHEKSQHGTIAHYRYALMSGSLRAGKYGPMKKAPAIDSTICVLYDRDRPWRSSVYPLSLVKIRTR